MHDGDTDEGDRTRRDDGGRVPLDLWAGVARRPLPRTAPPPPPPPPSVAAAPPPADHPVPVTSAMGPALDVARDASPAPAAARGRRRRRLLLRVGVLVVVLGLAAAIVAPNLMDDPGEPRLARPTTPSKVDPTALLPDLVFGEDHAADVPLPEPLSAAPQAPTGTDERWRLTAEDIAGIWAQAAPDEEGAETPLLVTASHATAGAAHEPNVSGVVPVVLTGIRPSETWQPRRLLAALDAADGAVLWTWAFDTSSFSPCQVVGRGASIVCTVMPSDPASATTEVTVLAARTGAQVAAFTTVGCSPMAFVQHGTGLYWAGIGTDGADVCVGGGAESFATLTGGGMPDSFTEMLTLTATGPLVRSPGASLMLTEAGWRGYRGWVEPGPDGLIVRQITASDGTGEYDEGRPPALTTIVCDLDGTTVVRASGPAWRRLDLVPGGTADPRLAELVGIGGDAYDTSGERRLSLQTGDPTPYTVNGYAPAPTVTGSGVLAYVTIDDFLGRDTTERWTSDQVVGGEPGERHETARMLVAEVDGVIVSLDGEGERIEETSFAELDYSQRDVVLEKDGRTSRHSISVLYGMRPSDAEPSMDGGMYTMLSGGSSPVALVGELVVASDDGGLVALG
ncbi:hypothetical protein HF995_03305 [Sanguibacter hominis ATCC BAA-789]|uniref:Uncharacterized protein n=1 Tax=Sanguibacter hominis ATCC BAA-789 TaxID=1312740 RepID=A0A9X5F9I2_9MICO|nr:hypothetical protein [Sanguibacter hominis]NKX92306.1 hypothetical protein [Sanguibacter hominis ATCC BAA-789]